MLVAPAGAGSAGAGSPSAGSVRRLGLIRSPIAAGDLEVVTDRADVTVIRISAFSTGIGARVADAVAAEHGRAVLLDLRGNPGGLVDEAVATAGVFLDGGPIVSYPDRSGNLKRRFAAPGGDQDVPVAVLVDDQTASAAEIVAAALQDRGRALLVGRTTYGKGTVEIGERELGRFVTPAGRAIDHVGIRPDVLISTSAGPEEARARAYWTLVHDLARVP